MGFKVPAAMPPAYVDPTDRQDYFRNLYTIFGEKAQNFILDLNNHQKPGCFRWTKKTRVSVRLWDGLTHDVIMQNEYSGWASVKAGYVRAFYKMAEELKDRVVREKC